MRDFVDRQLLRFSKSRQRTSEIRPAITPEMIPEPFELPEATRHITLPPAQTKVPQAEATEFMTRKEEEEKELQSETRPRRKAREAKVERDSTRDFETPAVHQSPHEAIISHIEGHSTTILPHPPEPTPRNGGKLSVMPQTKTDRGAERKPVNIDSGKTVAVSDNKRARVEENATEPIRQIAEIHTTDQSQTISSVLPQPLQSLHTPPQIVDSAKHDLEVNDSNAANYPAKVVQQRKRQQKQGTVDVRRDQAPETQPEAEPTVTVDIGRIEVRAILPEPPFPPKTAPVLSLEEYMKQRRENI